MLTDCCRLGSDTTAAPAAVFPSARASTRGSGPNWRRLDYLAKGNPRQRSAHALLTSGPWAALTPLCQDLALVSTVAIGLDQPGSDLDILCQHGDPAALAALLATQGWQPSDKGGRVWLAERTLSGPDGQAWPLELYITPDPVETRHGWRHLSLMAALLERFGYPFYQAVLRLRRDEGLKGEAAMCRLLGLPGCPYQALLTLEECDLGELTWSPALLADSDLAPSVIAPSALTPHPLGSRLPGPCLSGQRRGRRGPSLDAQDPMSTLFISDIHLSQGRPDMTAALVRFLEQDAPGADALYVLGDLFEFWIGDDDPNPLHREVADAFLALSQQGVPVYFIHGNRDFLLGRQFAKRAGMTLLGDPCVIDLYGERVLLSHGDLLCTLDLDYQKFRRITQLRWLRWLFLRLPLSRRQRIAHQMRGQSRMENAGKQQTIMDVTPAAVDEMLRQHGCRTLIHGHTHRPAVHDFMLDGRPVRRIVLGDWFEQGSILICSPAGQRLETRALR